MFWTDNMCIPLYAQNPMDAMTSWTIYDPEVAAVIEDYNDYVCPVPAAQEVMRTRPGRPDASPTARRSSRRRRSGVTRTTVCRTERRQAWNETFFPFSQGSDDRASPNPPIRRRPIRRHRAARLGAGRRWRRTS